MASSSHTIRRRWRRRLLTALILLMIGAFLVSATLGMRRGYRLTFPKRDTTFAATPSVPYQTLTFPTDDNIMLDAWYVPSQNRASIIVVHGLDSNRSSVLPIGEVFAARGYGVLLFDLRAHGRSGGDRYAFGYKDVIAARRFLAMQRDVDPARIGAYGLSLGGVAVIQGAARDTTIAAMIADGAGAVTIEDFPPRQSLLDFWFLPYDVASVATMRYLSGEADRRSLTSDIRAVAPRPILLIAAGGRDAMPSPEQLLNQRFFDAALMPKALWVISGIGHTGGWAASPAAYEERVITFFDSVLLKGEP